ncbi:MAG: 4Fe-4S binding protein [Candidatus Methanomethylophilaceae archaeon]|nr:4Fe-4S binding protein [Candidatus Methanomethylophilaceae archaeon]
MIRTAFQNLVSSARNTEDLGDIVTSRGTMPMASDECTSCGGCIGSCPTGAIMITDGTWRLDLGRCVFCMDCIDACVTGAIGTVPSPDYALDRGDLVVDRHTDIDEVEGVLGRDIRRRLGGSVAVRELDAGSCNACEMELNNLSDQFYDIHRIGVRFVASPRHADVLLVTGPMTRNMAVASDRTRRAVPEPSLVIASGTCAISGGVFVGGDVVEGSTGAVMEPDAYLIGCPPPPDRVMRSLSKMLGLH